MFLILEAPAGGVKPCWSPGQCERQSGECWSHQGGVPVAIGCSVFSSQGNCFLLQQQIPLWWIHLWAAQPQPSSTVFFLGLFCPSQLVYLPLEAWGDLQDTSFVTLETETDSSPSRFMFGEGAVLCVIFLSPLAARVLNQCDGCPL